jgi:hypothetical protein
MVRHFLQHRLNSLHVMALAERLGVSRTPALALAHWWERRAHPVLYRAHFRPGSTRGRAFAASSPDRRSFGIPSAPAIIATTQAQGGFR